MKNLIFLILLINFVDSYFDAEIDRFDLISQNTNLTDWSSMKVRKVNKIRCLVGEIKIYKSFGNDIMVQVKGYKKQGGEYRLMPYKLQPTPFCDFVKSDGLLETF